MAWLRRVQFIFVASWDHLQERQARSARLNLALPSVLPLLGACH